VKIGTTWRGLAGSFVAVAVAACSGGSSGGNSSPATLALSTSTLTFSATAGGAAPAPQTVTVTNSGAGTLSTPTTSIAYGSGSGWLAATVSGSAAPYTISVQPAAPGLAVGTYAATISVSSEGAASSPQTVTVTLTVGASPTFTLSGTFTAAAGIAVDGDVADPNAPVVRNDTAQTAQAVPSAVTVGGWSHETLDQLDVYRSQLAAGQRITLAIADLGTAGAVDLDLCLYAVADTSTPVACSMGTTAVEQLGVAAAGDYYVVVGAISGASNYTLTLGVGGASVPTLSTDLEFVPGQVLVQFRPTAIAAAKATTLATQVDAMGLQLLDGGWDRPSLLAIPLGAAQRSAVTALGSAGRSVAPFGAPLDGMFAEKLETLQVVKALRARADVETADPNYIFHPTAVPNDRFYSLQWHYPLINLPQAWDVSTGSPSAGSDVIVAVVDTGVFLAHPDFTGQLVAGYDFVSSAAMSRDGDGMDSNPDDPGDGAALGASSWHGTHVAGTIAARSNDAVGVAGVSWGAKVMPIRVLGAGGGTSADIVNGVRYAAGLSNASGTVPTRRADVINLSLGGPGSSATEQAVYAAVRNAGVIVVAAAGNNNSGVPFYPASYDGVVSVSAVDMRREKAPYSNFGPFVDIAAPGGDASVDRNGDGYADGVLSAKVDDSSGTRKPIWGFSQGTSMASPHVAGVVALMKAVCPALTPSQLDTIISSGAMSVDLGASGRDDIFGHGLVDASRAVQSAQAQCGSAPVTSLNVNPPRLDLAPGQATAVLTATKVGTGAISVSGVADDAAWLTVTGPGTTDGVGTYTIAVDASGLADGRYAATITFTVQDGAIVRVPVSLQKGAQTGVADAGYLYVLLLNDKLATVAQASGRGTNGSYPYQFTGVHAGSYFIAAGSDRDNDNVVCDPGEACGAWPTMGVPTALEVTADQNGLDFLVGFGADLAATSADGTGSRGYPLLSKKAFGGAR
jgi:serine protease